MRRIIIRSLAVALVLLIAAGAYVGLRAYGVYQTAYGGFQHLRYLLEEGETVEGTPADDVLSDDYLRSLFGDNPELVDRLKAVVDLGMATDANLKLGSVSAMIVTYQKSPDGTVIDPAIYAVGGFPDPKSQRLGFHSSGYLNQEVDPELWLTGNSVMNLLGRDIIVFCEEEKAEQHMALLYDLLQGRILPLAQKVVANPVHYAIVFPDPKELAPPNLRNSLQTVLIKGEMGPDSGRTETIFVSANYRGATQNHVIFKDMSWGRMNDNWWAVEFVNLLDNTKLVQDQVLVVAEVETDRAQNNVLLKTVERAGRDLAMQKAYLLASELPWEFAFREKASPSGGYWSEPHRWGSEWPLGQEGIPTPGSIADAEAKARAEAEKQKQADTPPASDNPPPTSPST